MGVKFMARLPKRAGTLAHQESQEKERKSEKISYEINRKNEELLNVKVFYVCIFTINFTVGQKLKFVRGKYLSRRNKLNCQVYSRNEAKKSIFEAVQKCLEFRHTIVKLFMTLTSPKPKYSNHSIQLKGSLISY
jgi:hypothetical protein